MPDSVSVNTMCFLFRAGVGALIVQRFLCGPNGGRARGKVACGESSLLKAPETAFVVKGPTSEAGILHPNLGRASPPPHKPHSGEGHVGWPVISSTWWGRGELVSERRRPGAILPPPLPAWHPQSCTQRKSALFRQHGSKQTHQDRAKAGELVKLQFTQDPGAKSETHLPRDPGI